MIDSVFTRPHLEMRMAIENPKRSLKFMTIALCSHQNYRWGWI